MADPTKNIRRNDPENPPWIKPKTDQELLAEGILPCGHAAEIEYDVDINMVSAGSGGRIINDYCFVCGWMSDYRRESDKLNDLATSRGAAETELMKLVKTEDLGLEIQQRELLRLGRRVRHWFDLEAEQRRVVNSL